MKYKGFTVYAERDNGVITTVSTYQTSQEALEAMKRFTDRYKNTHVKFVKVWVEEAKGAAI